MIMLQFLRGVFEETRRGQSEIPTHAEHIHGHIGEPL
jgi:hypothetical protein